MELPRRLQPAMNKTFGRWRVTLFFSFFFQWMILIGRENMCSTCCHNQTPESLIKKEEGKGAPATRAGGLIIRFSPLRRSDLTDAAGPAAATLRGEICSAK